ncbi:tyrosine-type recombinase/integrase [Streptomyces antibioticus]|uniref:tyrosine-type recombinase/integrase n=1 Tax=Streptomyces antibioticus TaxID=1890 RepID=UPI0036D94E1C
MSGRRGNGESSVYFSESDGKWHAWCTVGAKPDGRPDRRHRMAATETEVRAKLKELEKQRAAGRVRKAGRPPTIGQWMDVFLDTVCARKVEDGSMAPRTLDDYRSKNRLYITPGIGKHRIDRLAPEHLDKLYLTLLRSGGEDGEPLASSTVLKVHRVVSRALKVAMQREMITRNVATLLDAPSAEEQEIEPLTRAEARAVLDEAGRRRNGARWSVGAALGLRQGEALGMRWSYLDFETGMLRVHWQLQRLKWRHGCEDPHACGERLHRKACKRDCTAHRTYKRGCPKPCAKDCTEHASRCPERRDGGLVFRTPKGKNKRIVPVPAPLLSILKAQRTAQKRERLVAGELWEEHDLVFCQANGRPIDPRHDWEELQDILEVSGVAARGTHASGRHTAGTLLTENGVGLRVVMEILGHSQPRVAQRYTHVSSPLAEDAATKMGDALWG